MQIWSNEQCLVPQLEIADSFARRFIGLMGRRSMGAGEGLLLKQCGSIHTCFMRFPIDVIYLSHAYTVLDSETVKPWRAGKLVKGAAHVLELPKGCRVRFPAGYHLEVKQEGAI